MTPSTAMLSRRAAFIVACVLVALCYLNSLPNDFVFDDGPIVASNPAIRTINPVLFLKTSYWTQQQYEGIYRPFTIFSLSVDYAMWKRWAPGFRFTNFALHAMNGFLVFLLCTELVGIGIVPVAAMLIYIAHPVHTEAVTTIVGRSELFATCFLLSAWLLFRRGHTIWPGILFALALLSKENAIVLPGILILDAWLSGRFRRERPPAGRFAPRLSPFVRGTLSEPPPAVPPFDDVEPSQAVVYIPDSEPPQAPQCPPYEGGQPWSEATGRGSLTSHSLSWWTARWGMLVAVAIGYLGLRYSVLGGFGIPKAAQYMGGQLTYVERLMTSGRVFLEYLRLVFFPLKIAGDYDFNAIPIANTSNWDAWLGLLLIVGIAAAAFFYRKRNWVVSFGVLFAFMVFVPASNWIMPISVLLAERFLYLPLIGISIALAVAFGAIRQWPVQRLVGAGALLTAIVVCNGHDYIRRNDFTFFGNMVRVEPNSAKGRLGYGFALLQAGMMADAERELQAGLQIIPDYPELLTTLAMTRMTKNDCSRAWPLLNRANQINPSHADTHRRMGDCYMKEGKIQQAEAMYRQAVQSIPYPDSMLYFMWGRTLEETGQKEAAVSAYERAALIDPGLTFIQEKLAALK